MEGLSSSSIMGGNRSSSSSVERTKRIAGEDPVSQLPEEVVQHIFSYLNPIELSSNSLVSRAWYRLSSDPYLWNALDLTKTFPYLTIFDASDWEKHFGLKLEDEPPIDNRTLIPILEKFSSLPIEKLNEESVGGHIKKDAGVTLLTIPKGLTLKKLVEMAKEGDKVLFRYVYEGILKEMGDNEVDETYRILITNNVLEESRGLSVEKQKDLVEETFGCERPSALAALALVVTTFISSGRRLYRDNPWTFTRCPELVHEKDPVIIGGFGPDGLEVYDSFSTNFDSYGAAALRKVYSEFN